MRRRRPRPAFPPALLGPVAIATAAAATVPSFPVAAAVVVLVAAMLRLFLLRGGREIESPRAWTVLWASGPAIATAYVSAVARGGGDAGPALLAAGAVAVAVGVIAPSTPAGWARLLGLSGLLVAGACLASPRASAVLGAIGFVVLLVPAALAFGEARVGSDRATAAGTEGLVRRVSAPMAPAAPGRARLSAALLLLLVGLPAGLVFFWALPAKPAGGHGGGRSGGGWRDGVFHGEEPGGRARPADENEADPPFMGPSAGDRSSLQQNLRLNAGIVLTVRIAGGERSSIPLWLRGTTYDRWNGRTWTRSTAAQASTLTAADPTRPGWYEIEPRVDAAAAPTWRLRAIDIDGRASRTALWILPGATRIHLDARAGTFGVRRAADGAINVPSSSGWLPGDSYETAGPYFGVDRTGLEALASDASVAPFPGEAAPPPDAKAFKDVALAAVGSATSAAERATRLEAWLRSAEFAHAVTDLKIDPKRPVADFLFRAKRGNCWCFASAMALMMRSLGHAARLATGLRGGEWNAAATSYDFRGTDAHAWCEVAYERRGWVIYDPSPAGPDDEASADAQAAAADGGTGGADDSSVWDRLAGYSPDDRAQWLDRVGATVRGLGTAFATPIAWAFLAVLAALLGALVLVRRRRTSSEAAAVGGAPPLRGPYARALAALAGAGVPRRACETPSEFRQRAATAVPQAGEPLRVLTVDHDAARYGGASLDDAAVRRDEAASEEIAAVARGPRLP